MFIKYIIDYLKYVSNVSFLSCFYYNVEVKSDVKILKIRAIQRKNNKE